MAKRILHARSGLHLIDQLGSYPLVDDRLQTQGDQQFGVETRADHRGGAQGALSRGIQAVDARSDSGLQGGRHTDMVDVCPARIVAVLSAQDAPFAEISHDLLCEKRVAADARRDRSADLADRRVRSEQLAEQYGGLRITQWGKLYRLRTGQSRQ